MKKYLRTISFLRPYWGRLTLASLSAAVYAVFSAMLIWMFGPLLLTLFHIGSSTPLQSPQPAPQALVQDQVGRVVDQTGFLYAVKEGMKGAVDSIVHGPTPSQTLFNFCILILVITVLKNGFNYLQGFQMAYVQQAVTRDIRNKLFEKYQDLSVDYFYHERTGALMSRVTNDVNTLNEALDASFSGLIVDLLTTFMLAAFLVILSWKLTLLAAISLPAVLGFIYYIGKKIRVYSGRSQERMADVTAVLEENISNIRLVKAFGAEKTEIAKFRAVTQKYFAALLRMTRVNRLSSPINDTLASGVGVIILLFAGAQVVSGTGELDAADFLVFVLAMFSFIKPAKSLSQIHARMQQGLAAADRIFDTLDTTPKIVDKQNATTVTDLRRGIEYRNVTFSYNGRDEVLRDISFAVRKGEVVALVGPSGGGKSTIVDLLPRFHDPASGTVLFDDIDIRDITLESLRSTMGVVTQETYLFNDTIAANISFGSERVTAEQITAAAVAANADEFISQFPDKYETVVGNRGVRLSGGQRQRLAIARALLRNPAILVFDEATSALDTQSEHLVQGAINNLLHNRTVVVVAHRLSTIRHADRILVIDDGRITEQGTHEELLALGGLYRTLYRLQFHDELLTVTPRG